MKCWNCQAETHGAAFCPACGKIGARSPESTHFDVFGLPPSFDLDLGEVERRYHELSLKLHPDRFAQADPRERRLSLEQTSALNEAWRTLRDPISRALYLLRLHGVLLEDEHGMERLEMPQDFLMEILDLREALEGLRAKKDLDGALEMAEDVRRREKASLDEAADALRALEKNPGDEASKMKAAVALGRMRYFTRFLQEVEAIEEEALA